MGKKKRGKLALLLVLMLLVTSIPVVNIGRSSDAAGRMTKTRAVPKESTVDERDDESYWGGNIDAYMDYLVSTYVPVLYNTDGGQITKEDCPHCRVFRVEEKYKTYWAFYPHDEGIVLGGAERRNVPVPRKRQADFIDWVQNQDDFLTDKPIMLNRQGITITLDAKYYPDRAYSYDITWDAETNGGTITSTDYPTFYFKGEGVPANLFPSAEKANCRFDGWFDAATGGNRVTSIGTTEEGDKTLYAQFTENSQKYTISYEMNGGTVPSGKVLPASYIAGTGLPAGSFPSLTKSGYSFIGWFDAQTGGNQVVSIPAAKTGDITLYARFSRNSSYTGTNYVSPVVTPYVPAVYSITYVMNGGTNDPRNPSTYLEYQTVTLQDAWKTGAEFDGWYLSPDGNGKVTSINRHNVTVYAHFTPYKYKISYSLNGGVMGAGNSDAYLYGETPSLHVEPTREGSRFIGWSLSPDGSNPFKIWPSSVYYGDVTLYAVYLPLYTITYVLNGGTNNPSNPSQYLSTETVTLEMADKKDMKFIGWYDAPEGGNLVTTVSGGNITVYARFIHGYDIFYDCDGGTNHKNNPDYYEVEKGAIINDAYKKGYDFIGWVMDGSDTLIHSIPAGHTGNVILHAKWTPVPDLKGATVYLNHDQGLVYNATGQSVSLKKIVTKDGVVITSFKHCKVLGLTAREAGTHEVTVKGDGDRYTGKCTAKFKIAKARMLDAKIKLSQITYYFAPGVKNKPNVQFYLNGIRMNMKLDKDYTAKYDRDVIHAGKKSVVVRTTEDCNNLTIGEFTVTYEVKKSDTKFTAKVTPSKISIRDLKDDVQRAQVTITNLTKGSEDVRFSINSVSDINRKSFVTVDSESGRVTLYPARWSECKIEIQCTSHANADRKKLVKYVSIVVQ